MTERRFRASVYVDVWVPQTDDLEADRAEAQRIAEEFASLRPNSYVGGVAGFTGNIDRPFDREI
jgi:hypothetical protein